MNTHLIKFERPLLFFAATLIVGSVILFFVATAPIKEKIIAENDEIQKFYARTENDQQKISQLSEFRNQSVIIGNDESKLRLLLPENRVVDFIREVEGIAKSVGGVVTIAKGNNLEEIKKVPALAPVSDVGNAAPMTGTQEEKPVESLTNGLPEGKTIGFTLTFSGDYADAVNFLHKVDSSPYYLDVISMEIRPIEEEKELGVVRTDVFADSGSGGVMVVKRNPSSPKVREMLSIVVYLE
jgi:hypothetical protein